MCPFLEMKQQTKENLVIFPTVYRKVTRLKDEEKRGKSKSYCLHEPS